MSPIGPRSLHVVSSLDLRAGGPTQSVARLCEALNALGAPAEIATVLTPGEPSQIPDGTRVHTFPPGFPARVRRSPELGQFLLRETGRFDLVHVHGLWQWPGLQARWAAERAGRPLVLSPRGMLEPWSLRQRPLVKRLALATWEGRTLASCRLLHATAASEAAQFQALGFRGPCCIVPNPIEIPDLPGQPKPVGRREILFMSRFHPKKGVDLLLQAWARLQGEFPDWRLHLRGPDPDGYRSRMEDLAASLGIPPGSLQFGPAVDGPEKAALVGSASLFVLPSHSENFGNVVAEALAAGVPVVTTFGTPWEELQTRGCGWWIPVSTEALMAALREALTQAPEALAQMGARGRSWMMQEVSPGVVASRMLAAYRGLFPSGSHRWEDASDRPRPFQGMPE